MTEVETIAHFQKALAEIACGRKDNGRALGGETARQIARKAMIDTDHSWSKMQADFKNLRRIEIEDEEDGR